MARAIFWTMIYGGIGGGIGFFTPWLYALLQGVALPSVGTLRKSAEAWRNWAFHAFLWIACLYYTPFSLSAAYGGICSVLLLISVCDLREKIVPDRLLIALSLFSLLLFCVRTEEGEDLLLGALVAGGVFYLLHLVGDLIFRRSSIGIGDVRLMALLGFILGTGGVFWAFVLSVVFAGISASVEFFGGLSAKKEPEDERAFAPYLAFGGIIVLIFGDEIKRIVVMRILSFFL